MGKMSECLIRLHIEKLPEGFYLATSKDIPGLIAQGRTVAETVEIAQDVASKILESYQENGHPLPDGITTVPDAFDVSVSVIA